MPDSELLPNEWWNEAFEMLRDDLRPSHEFDWFAVDAKGQIACFITAGFGSVPKLVLRNKVACWKVYNYFYNEPDDKNAFSSSYTLMDYDLSHYASRGLYIYDQNPNQLVKPYQLIKYPKTPCDVKALPEEIKAWIEPLTFRDLVFSDTPEIRVSNYFDCV